jgi:glycerophosphoryl diester phosphodiesterase
MKRWLTIAAFVVALLILLVTVVNASWTADAPQGGIRLIAHRGVAQHFDRAGVGNDTCTASRIEPPVHDYLENTVRSMDTARRMGADMVEIDIAPTADGKIGIFHDWTLECRTDGRGAVRSKTLAELKALDIGHGYSADGGRTYPFRGRGKDSLPSLEEALMALPATAILFNFKSNDPREADLLAAALKAAGRDVARTRDAFYGAPAPVERIKTHFPKAWAWSMEAAKRCTTDYAWMGWATIVPESCRNGTLIVPLNKQWLFAGWPNRLIARMKAVDARVIVTGAQHEGEPNTGLVLPEQLGEVPSTFAGYIWVDDIWNLGPALRPHKDFRNEGQLKAANAALDRRRARMD